MKTKMNELTEKQVRNKLYRRGYHLIKTKDCYGCDAYLVADDNNVVIGSDNVKLSLDEVVEMYLSNAA